MFCEKCGKKNPDDVRFCEHCGAPQGFATFAAAPAPSGAFQPMPTQQAAPAEQQTDVGKKEASRPKKKWILPLVAVLAVLVVAAVALWSIFSGKVDKTVHVSSFVKVEASGFDGYGSVSWEFDERSFGLRALGNTQIQKFGDGKRSDWRKAQEAHKKEVRDLEDLIESVQIDYALPEDRTGHTLQNGDKVMFTIEIDEDLAEEMGITLEGLTYEYVVEGLRPVETVDLMQNLDIYFDGINGYGRRELVYNGPEEVRAGDLCFRFDSSSYTIAVYQNNIYLGYIYITIDCLVGTGSSNDDLMVIRLRTQANDWIEYGVVLATTSKEIVVSGLQEPQSFDILANLTMSFAGADGRGQVVLDYEQDEIILGDLRLDYAYGDIYYQGDYVGYMRMYPDKRTNLRNGDEVTVTLSVNEDNLLRYGLIPARMERTFIVSGLPEYPEDMDSIRGSLTEVSEDGRATIENLLQTSWYAAVHGIYRNSEPGQILEPVTLYKAVLTTSKNESSYTRNTLWLIYKVTVTDEKYTEPTDVYLGVYIDNVAVYPDGTLYLTLSLTSTYQGMRHGQLSYEAFFEKNIQSSTLNIYE